jgi:hypothetical protein
MCGDNSILNINIISHILFTDCSIDRNYFYYIYRTLCKFSFYPKCSRTSAASLSWIRNFYSPISYLSFLLFRNYRIGIPFDSCSPNEWTRLSTIIMSFNSRLWTIRKSFIKNPFCVSMQFFRCSTPKIVFFF